MNGDGRQRGRAAERQDGGVTERGRRQSPGSWQTAPLRPGSGPRAFVGRTNGSYRSAALPLCLLLAATCTPAPQEQSATTRITIPRGAGLAAVAESLYANDVVASPGIFRFYARLSGKERQIPAGTYDIPTGAPVRDVLAVLVRGRPVDRQLVMPEGLMLTEVAVAVERQLGVSADDVLAAARDSTLIAYLGVPAETLEGYLFPDTYRVPIDVDARGLVRRMIEEFDDRWTPAWDARADSLGLSRHEVVTLASIIEGEVRHDPDRRFVSSVYHNRLRRGMRLQADPTVIYALGRRRRLFERDYQTPSPYNTYLIDGLPPGPIGQPSEESLEAALYPAATDLLYFVARPDGHHVFSRTHAEHMRAVTEIRRMQGRQQ